MVCMMCTLELLEVFVTFLWFSLSQFLAMNIHYWQTNKQTKTTKNYSRQAGKNGQKFWSVSAAFVNYDLAPNKRKIQNSHLPRALGVWNSKKILQIFPPKFHHNVWSISRKILSQAQQSTALQMATPNPHYLYPELIKINVGLKLNGHWFLF